MTAQKIASVDAEKYSELVHHIVHMIGDMPNFGTTLLNKILYFSDFDFYELNYRSITNESYRKIQFGPIPCHIDRIQKKLIKEKKVVLVDSDYFGYRQKKLICAKAPEIKHLTNNELKVIDDVIKRISSMSGKQVSEYSHLDIPWKVTEDKKIIDYEYVFHRAPITSVRPD